MVLDSQNRHYGGMGYDNMYSSMHTPQFTDPWAHQTSNHAQYSTLPKPDNRSALSMSYSQLPPTSAPLTSGSHYSTQDVEHSLNYTQDLPRSSMSYGEQHYSSPPTTSSTYSTSFPSMNYAQQLHQQQAQQQRKLSDV